MSQRLQKLLAAGGHGSRRQIEEWIRAGRLTVDGRIAALGDRAIAAADIRLDGRVLSLAPPGAREVLMYHKPAGEVTTRSDPEGRPNVFERLPAPHCGRWIVIGRLDVNTTGLLLFTTDGALAHRWMHPSAQIEREYLVRVQGHPPAAVLARLREGIRLEDGPARFERLEPLRPTGTEAPEARTPEVEALELRARGLPAAATHSWFRAVLCEGRNREVRRLWSAVGFEVSRLSRIRFGSVSLPRNLRAGHWQRLSADVAGLL
jgi:23S rRNA pseudouridine2605 synthase